MKVVKILSLLVLMNFVSCSTDENEAENNLKSYNSLYMDYINLYNGSSGSVKLEYDSKNRIIKRNGGLVLLPASTGIFEAYLFSDEVIEDIVYNNNEIKTIVNPGICYCFNERKMILDKENRLIKKIIYKRAPQLNDTILYTYNILNQIDKTLKLIGKPAYVNPSYEKAKYYYNQKQNLDSIVTYKNSDDIVFSSGGSFKTVEIFSNYDNASNPLKKLIIFDETYFRALSKNNYAKYEYRKYSYNVLTENSTRNYNFNYDTSGNIYFDFVK